MEDARARARARGRRRVRRRCGRCGVGERSPGRRRTSSDAAGEELEDDEAGGRRTRRSRRARRDVRVREPRRPGPRARSEGGAVASIAEDFSATGRSSSRSYAAQTSDMAPWRRAAVPAGSGRRRPRRSPRGSMSRSSWVLDVGRVGGPVRARRAWSLRVEEPGAPAATSSSARPARTSSGIGGESALEGPSASSRSSIGPPLALLPLLASALCRSSPGRHRCVVATGPAPGRPGANGRCPARRRWPRRSRSACACDLSWEIGVVAQVLRDVLLGLA